MSRGGGVGIGGSISSLLYLVLAPLVLAPLVLAPLCSDSTAAVHCMLRSR